MIELDRTLEPLCKLVNDCYEACFPNYPQFPKFSFTRAMITLWRSKVYTRLESNLAEALTTLLESERAAKIREGELRTNLEKKSLPAKGISKSVIVEGTEAVPVEEGSKSLMGPPGEDSAGRELIGRFVQTVADLSVNELKIHFLGSTKADLDDVYKELNRIIIKQTKYHPTC